MNHWKEEYLPMVALPPADESSRWAAYLSTKPLYRTPIGIIMPIDSDLLTALLFPESIYPNDKPDETTPHSVRTAEELIGLLSCPSSSPIELALAATLRKATNHHKYIRDKESLSLLEEIVYKLKVYISKKHWICSDPEFIEKLASFSNLAPEPESYSELLVALRHYSLLNPLERDLFDKVVYSSVLYDLEQTTEYLDTLNDTIEQASCRLKYLINPSVEEESIPECDEEEHYEDDDSVSSSSSSPSSLLEARVGDETWAAWWEGWKATYVISDDYTPDSVSSPPPLQVAWAAWWEGWKATYVISDDYTPDSVSSPPSLQVAWAA